MQGIPQGIPEKILSDREIQGIPKKILSATQIRGEKEREEREGEKERGGN